MLLGYTAGKFTDETNFLNRLRFFKKIGCTALELHFGLQEINNLALSSELIWEIKSFEYLSYHTPAANLWFDETNESKEVLDKIDIWIQTLDIKLVVIHPDRIKNADVRLERNWPLGLENMDWRKDDAKDVEQMQK